MPVPRELRAVKARAAAQVGDVRDPRQPGRQRGPQLGKRSVAPRPPARVPPGYLVICRLVVRGRFVGHLPIILPSRLACPAGLGKAILGRVWADETARSSRERAHSSADASHTASVVRRQPQTQAGPVPLFSS